MATKGPDAPLPLGGCVPAAGLTRGRQAGSLSKKTVSQKGEPLGPLKTVILDPVRARRVLSWPTFPERLLV